MNRRWLVLGLVSVVALGLLWGHQEPATGWVWLLSCAIGWLLCWGGFGFSGPLRRALSRGEPAALWPIGALLALLILGSGLLFSLAEPLGLSLRGLRAPLSLSLAGGAFLFGVGMVLARRCASGTLASARWGDWRCPATLAGLVAGVFLASLQRPAVEAWLPAVPPLVLLDRLPVGVAMVAQLAMLVAVAALLGRIPGDRSRPMPLEPPSTGQQSADWLRGAFTVVALATLLLLLFVVSGEPWKVLWGLAISGAHLAQAVGWDPRTSPFWNTPSRLALLASPSQWWSHGAVVMDLGVLWGAFLAGLWGRSGSADFQGAPRPGPLLLQATGGLLMGWGGFLAYGCNVSGFLGGVMSFSLHGWLWLVAALAGAFSALRLERALARLRWLSPNDPV